MKKMQLFTEVEFNSEEFEEIPRVLYSLGNEGWKVLREREFSTNIMGEEKITAKKYYLIRNI